MTNKEKYKQAFSVLHASDNLSQEVESMSRFQKRTKMKTAAAVIAGCVILGGTGTAYAANVGGIQRTIQLWIHGDQTSATMDISNDGSSSSYQIEYQDADGTTQQMNGGGISVDQDGNQRPLTQDEIMEELNAPDVEYSDDGKVTVYYKNQVLDITNKFDKDKICYVKIKDGNDTMYLTVKYNNGFSYSKEKYPDPADFN